MKRLNLFIIIALSTIMKLSAQEFKISGYGQILYEYSDSREVKHDLSLRNAFISIDGEINQSFKYRLLTDLSNQMLHEFWGEYSFLPQAKLKIGQFSVPVTVENQLTLDNLETIYYSRVVTNFIGGGEDLLFLQNGKNNYGKDIGIQLSGILIKHLNRNLLEYSVGLFQGTGITTKENNNTKDFAGSLYIKPLEQIQLVAGMYIGKANYEEFASNEIKEHVRNRYVLSGIFQSKRVTFRSEWIKAKDGSYDKSGIYALATYQISPNRLTLLGEVSYLKLQHGEKSTDFIIGLNFRPYKYCRIQLGYQNSIREFKAMPSKSKNRLNLQTQISF
ncbi:hypothetical protein JGH11_03305 [Dysgonomonas sp. Marseille-P4677]|uniref:hypothetical protein n=1 Tax=Dysgonomonas sp. Marseille-P4677 TaxID=2364790 RepID=UPI001912ACB2|nr:hypothetical protein [Dysgonomonas sp. Marseille-P4677]MBK5719891.1 hypothetical protein [Dysgonomonas sp. Marseille-P4677]